MTGPHTATVPPVEPVERTLLPTRTEYSSIDWLLVATMS